MILSIVVITMNRAEQLRLALESCANSKLPKETEFVVIDNASNDDTEIVVKDFFDMHPYPYIFEKEMKNKGVGGGRNRGFELAHGKYVYFLDDDAVVAPESYDKFFIDSIALFERDSFVASITTRIYDELLGCDRAVLVSKKANSYSEPEIFMYLGGSHFLRKEYFDSPLYLDFKYGMEELLPSIYAMNKGYKNVYVHKLKVLHQPKRNKWVTGGDEKQGIIADYNVNNYISKRIIYPSIYCPLLFLAFICRTVYYFGLNKKMWRVSMNKLRMQEAQIITVKNKIKSKTVFTIIKNFSVGPAF